MIGIAVVIALGTLAAQAVPPATGLAARTGQQTEVGQPLHGRVFDTAQEKVYAGLRVELVTQPPREAVTDALGVFRLADVKPGAYLVRLHLPPGEGLGEHDHSGDSEEQEPRFVTTRVVVQAGGPTLRNFDLASIRHPDAESGY